MNTAEPAQPTTPEQSVQAPVFDYDEYIRQFAAQNNAVATYEDVKGAFTIAYGADWASSNAQEKTLAIMDAMLNPSFEGRKMAGVRTLTGTQLLYGMRNYIAFSGEFNGQGIDGLAKLRN